MAGAAGSEVQRQEELGLSERMKMRHRAGPWSVRTPDTPRKRQHPGFPLEQKRRVPVLSFWSRGLNAQSRALQPGVVRSGEVLS